LSQAEATHWVSQALWLSLVLSGPPVAVAAVVGLLIAVVQAATQVQDPTFPYAVKLLAIVLTLFVMASTLGGVLLQYTDLIMASIPRTGSR
jgi:type III secretion protein S